MRRACIVNNLSILSLSKEAAGDPPRASTSSACSAVLMRRAQIALTGATVILAFATPVWAHGAEELGHHWEIPAYRAEMLTQLAIMAGVAIMVFGGLLIKNALRRRRARS
jgi:hypothetical protein